MTKELNEEMECATNFKSELITYVNPDAGKVDKWCIFGLSQHKETSHKGMKMVFKAIRESFQLFDSHDDGRYIRLPNAKRRKINLLVDQLTVKNFRSLKYELIK